MKIGISGRVRELRLVLATRLAGAPPANSDLSRGIQAPRDRFNLPDAKQTAYVDLAPTDKADETGVLGDQHGSPDPNSGNERSKSRTGEMAQGEGRHLVLE